MIHAISFLLFMSNKLYLLIINTLLIYFL